MNTCEAATNSTNNLYDKVFVINLDSATDRLEKISSQLEMAGIEFERFPAVNGYNVQIKNLHNNQIFSGADIKAGTNKLVHGQVHTILCNPGEEKAISFIFIHNSRYGASAGELGIWCSFQSIWEIINEKKFNKTIIFEDDIKLKNPITFKNDLNNFLAYTPESFDIGYLDLQRQVKGTKIALPNNTYVNSFTKGSITHGNHAIVYAQKAVSKLLSSPCYTDAIDIYLWKVTEEDSKARPLCLIEPINLESYVSSVDLIDLAGGSIINEMGRY